MAIKGVYWRQLALNNLKILLQGYQRQGKRVGERIIAEIEKDIRHIKNNPLHGYLDPALSNSSRRVFTYFAYKRITIVYYMEDGMLFIVDFR